MNLAKILVAAALVAVTLPAQAAGVGLRAGTTGVGADIGWSLAPTLNARVGYSAFSYSHHLNPTDVLIADTLVFTRTALSQIEEWLS